MSANKKIMSVLPGFADPIEQHYLHPSFMLELLVSFRSIAESLFHPLLSSTVLYWYDPIEKSYFAPPSPHT